MQIDYRGLVASKILVPAALILGLAAATVGLAARNSSDIYPSSSFPPPYSGPRVEVPAQSGDTFYELTDGCPPTFRMNGRTYRPKHPGQYWADDAAGASYKSPGEVLRIGEGVSVPAICRK